MLSPSLCVVWLPTYAFPGVNQINTLINLLFTSVQMNLAQIYFSLIESLQVHLFFAAVNLVWSFR